MGLLSLLVSNGPASGAGNWIVHLATVNSAEAEADPVPTAPTPSAACATPTSLKKVAVTWAAITHATNYGVHQSTTVGGTYTLQATVTTTTWTSAALAANTYFYEVVANIGAHWASAKSTATAKRTISSTICS